MSDAIQLFDVSIASKLVQCGDEVILFGVAPEINKSIQLKKLPHPTVLVIPEKIIIGNNLQNCTEFPLYYFLFFANQFSNHKKLKILGSSEALRNNQKLLRLSLFGPTYEEYLQIGLSDHLISMFSNEINYFAMKDSLGQIISINQMIQNYPFNENNSVQFSNIQIFKISFNTYKISYLDQVEIIDLNTTKTQSPPYPISVGFSANELSKFSVEILGGSNGFSSTSPSSGMLITYNGNYILIDAIPFLDHHLINLGISKHQIHSIFLTHIHDDHCNLFTFINHSRKINIITTKEIFWMAMFKLSLMINIPILEVTSYFNFIPLNVGYTLDYYGLKIKPHYSIHTIPTIGATFSVDDTSSSASFVISADNQSLDDIQNMLKNHVITPKRAEDIYEIYRKPVDYLFADGGQGVIHGNPRDAINSLAKHVIFFHLDKLPPEFDSSFSLATSGKRYVLLQGANDFYITRAIEFFFSNFPEIPSSWISILMGHARIVRYNVDDVILKQESFSNNKVFIIITGYCSIVHYDGHSKKTLAYKQAGDLFGEMAIFDSHKKRNASVIAQTSVTLCEIPENIFYSLVLKEKIKDELQLNWKNRDIIAQLPFFEKLPYPVIDALSKLSKPIKFSQNQSISYDQNHPSFFLICTGQICVQSQNHSVLVNPGQFFSNSLDPSFKISSNPDSYCLYFLNKQFYQLLDQFPILKFSFRNPISYELFPKPKK